jgi:hypothetical protein
MAPDMSKRMNTGIHRDRRFRAVLVAGALLFLPPAVLRLECVGRTCSATSKPVASTAPFCSLPADTRRLVAAGYYEGRSPDVLAVTGDGLVTGGSTASTDPAVPWPSSSENTHVPLILSGQGVRQQVRLSAGSGLDRIAPTIASLIHFSPPFPNVRSGRPLQGVTIGRPPKVVVEVALEGIGTQEIQAVPGLWPHLEDLLKRGAGTLRGTTGSLPLDPAAILTTIGTGGLPSEHGITGAILRDDHGSVARAWGPQAPPSVITTLPDDLDHSTGQRAKIGVVAPSGTDRGIVGGTWYPHHDRDLWAQAGRPAEAVQNAARMLRTGFGHDSTPDILAVVMRGPPRQLDTSVGSLVRVARRVAHGSVAFVVAGTGSDSSPTGMKGASVMQAVEAKVGPLVKAAVPGGLFLDERALAAAGATGSGVRDALAAVTGPNGSRLMADAFQSYAVSFGRYC